MATVVIYGEDSNGVYRKLTSSDDVGMLKASANPTDALGLATKQYVDPLYTQVVQIALNGSTALTTSDKAYFRIPAKLNGWNLTSVAAMCQTASSSGNPTFTIKKGATSMLSTNLTIDSGETDSSTSATPAVINTSQDDVTTGLQIEVACTVAGTGTLWTVVELVFTRP